MLPPTLITQQARQLSWNHKENDVSFRFLIRDHDSKYTNSFDNVFSSDGIDVIPTPLRAPNANAYAERWVRSLREECLDNLLILNEAHLRNVLNEYLGYYNERCPHQGLDQQAPIPRPDSQPAESIIRRKVLGGIINDYCPMPATALV